MKKIFFLLLIWLFNNLNSSYDFYGKSFFSIKSPYQSGSPEREAASRYFWLDESITNSCNSFDIVVFGGKTLGHELTKYFTPNGRTTLNVSETYFFPLVSEDNVSETYFFPLVSEDVEIDIEARNFNISTMPIKNLINEDPFNSKVRFRFEHAFFGLGLAYRRILSHRTWLEVSAPLMKVANRICIQEKVINAGRGSDNRPGLDDQVHVGTMTKALEEKGWKYGVMDRERSKWGLADIELKLGWITFDECKSHLRNYIGSIIPTGNKPDPKYLFAPVVGNNKHFGLMFGTNIGFELWCSGEHQLNNETDISNRYLFPNNQIRSFDLIGKQWSRYLEVYKSDSQAQEANDLIYNPAPLPLEAFQKSRDIGSFGINELTKKVRVSPGFQTTFNTALIYSYCNVWKLELGYNFVARQGEKIELDHGKNKFTAAIKSTNGAGESSYFKTIDKDTILCPETTIYDGGYALIQPKDLDLNSGAHPPMMSQTIYGNLSHWSNNLCNPIMTTIGGSYEFSHSNAGPTKFTIWGKVGMAF